VCISRCACDGTTLCMKAICRNADPDLSLRSVKPPDDQVALDTRGVLTIPENSSESKQNLRSFVVLYISRLYIFLHYILFREHLRLIDIFLIYLINK
jgi:hypothetical protein